MSESGFTLTEMLICAVILLLITSAAFGILSEIQMTAGYQAEVQSVLNSTRIAMQTVERCIRKAGNDPLAGGLTGITIVNATEVQIRSDLTGSAAGNPDKGDPDGDVDDSGENVAIRFNSKSHTIEIVPSGGAPQIIASNISDLMFQYFDASGAITSADRKVRKISVAISGTSTLPNPRTGHFFGIRLYSDVMIAT
jgi:prepilin-type N-terminal cleavage/methylation domain-containing protein